MLRLILFRHAKSDWDTNAANDHERPLAPRGVDAARTMGVVVARSGLVPDLVITSSAVRARTTVELAADEGRWKTRIVESDDLYGTSPEGALHVAATAPSTVESLMLVGHEPTWSGLAARLTDGRITVKTATIVGIDLAIGAWTEAPRASGEIAFVLQPRLFSTGGWEL